MLPNSVSEAPPPDPALAAGSVRTRAPARARVRREPGSDHRGRHLHKQRAERRGQLHREDTLLQMMYIVCPNYGQISMNNQRNGSYILFISYYLLQLFLDMLLLHTNEHTDSLKV